MITSRAHSAPKVAGLGLALCALLGSAAADENIGNQGMAVSIFRAEQKCFTDQVQVSGVLVPKAEVKIWAERPGLQIGQVLVEAGDSVGAGQVLARLSDPLGASPQAMAIKSPVSGIVTGLSAIVGSYVSPTAPDPLFRIVVDGELEMRGQVLAASLPRLLVGQSATLRLLGFGRLDGHVTSVETAIEPLTQLGGVRIAFAPDTRLRPGAFARGQIDTGQKCAVTVPLSAVLYGSGGGVVQVVKADRVETRRVELGLLQDGFIQIQDGVDAGDIVIARAAGFLREGDRVRPIPPDPARKP